MDGWMFASDKFIKSIRSRSQLRSGSVRLGLTISFLTLILQVLGKVDIMAMVCFVVFSDSCCKN